MIDSSQSTSTRPYLLRALYEWCSDNNLTPYVAAYVDDSVKVPRDHVKNNEIVLNISMDATSNLQIGNDFLQFKARFGGVAREIVVPIGHIIAIYARENGQGMAFPVPQAVPPRGEVKESTPAADRRSAGLRSVGESSSANPMDRTVTTDQAYPLPQSTIEPIKLVKLKSAPKPAQQVMPQERTQSIESPEPTEPPLTPNSDNPAGQKPGRPSLTRIK